LSNIYVGLITTFAVKTVSHITYTVLAGTSNTAQSNPILAVV